MSFFSGLGATLSNSAPALANTIAGNLQGQEVARQRKLQEGLAAIAQQRQAERDQLDAAFKQSEITKNLRPPPDPTATHATNRQFDLDHPLPVPPVNDPVKTFAANRDYAILHPLPVPEKPPAAMTPYQEKMLGLYQQRLDQQGKAAAAKAAQPTPDQIKSQTVQALAGPAADALIAYHGGSGGMKQGAAAALSHVPLAGNFLEGKVDPAYQNATNNARVLATQYLEIMPKSRFQPSTVDDIMKQIAPSVGDAPATKASKIARIHVLKDAIAKRAAIKTDGPPLDDIPEPPPGVEQQ